MSVNYAKHFSTRKTDQSQPIPGRSDMVKNNAGGFVFTIDKWSQMLRFLILESENGTYYVGEKKLTAENAGNTVKCIQENPRKAVDLILDVSTNGRASKQDATLFALALACTFAPEKDRPYAYAAITKVCRTGTMLFQFVDMIKSLRGWSRGLRNGVSKFYTMKPLDKLELQVIKYRNRAGYTHKDVMRLSHPQTTDTARNTLLKYAVGKMDKDHATITEFGTFMDKFKLVGAYEDAKGLDPKSHSDTKKLVNLITDSGLPREGVPTQFLNKPDVWHALLEKMPVTGLVRNLGKMSSLDMTRSNMSVATTQIVSLLRNEEAIKKSRIHPMQLLMALKTYGNGRGDRGSLTWNPNPKILDALDDAFYLSFGNVESTGKRHMLALDVSGSMGWNYCAGNLITAREASAAMSMLTARTEANHDFIAFTDGGRSTSGYGRNRGVTPLSISPRDKLGSVVSAISNLPFGGTDCALPMIYAEKHKIPVDTFVIYTDNETWAGNIHPKQALDSYRQKMGIPARVAVVGMTASGFSIADPKDSGMLDVVGFDTATPNILREFSLGNF